jgi:hypothetical protein
LRCIAGIATLTLKKSSTTMNVPARITGRAAPVSERPHPFEVMRW